MAVRDISFYKYLEATFRYRLFNPQGASATPDTRFNYLGYNLPFKRIFYYARRILPKFYTNAFPDTEEGNLQMARSVLQKLDKHQDSQLEKYFDPVTAPEENVPVIAGASQESAAQQAPPAAAATAGPLPGMAISPLSVSAVPRRIIHTIPPAATAQEAETPKIVIANKNGVVAEKPPAEFHVTDKSGNITATYSKELAPAAAQPKLVIANKSGVIKEAPPKQIFIADKSGIVTGVRDIKPPGWLKTFGSNAQIFARRNLGRIAGGLADIAKGAGKGIMEAGKTGLGAAAPSLGRAFHGGLDGIERITRPGGMGGGIGKGLSKSSNKLALGLIGILLLVLIVGLLGGLTGTTSPDQDGSLPDQDGLLPPAAGSDISSCKFFRGQENPKEAAFKSSLLLSYIQEASQKSSIPAAVLAAFIRVESPSSSNMSDSQISGYAANCAESPTGALGIMQIQPPGTTSLRGDPASCDDCIDAGARLAGKTVSTMTRQDYCDPRTNIIVGAGWILKKMSKLGYGDGTKWDPEWTNNRKAIEALVNTYYGCLNYGGPADCSGPYNYADDVSASIQNCRAQPTIAAGGGFASQLVDKIKKSIVCNGIVSILNAQSCIDSVQPVPDLTAQEIIDSALSYLYLQCVGFVQAVAGGINGQKLDGASSAYMYKDFPPPGYKFTARIDNNAIIKAGDLAIWDKGDASIRPDGHVAYVVHVYDGSRFDVAEANWSGRGAVGIRSVNRNEIGFAGWAQKL